MAPGITLGFVRSGRTVIAPTQQLKFETSIRTQIIGERFGVLVCSFSGDHGHVAAACSMDRAPALAQAVQSSLTQVCGLKPGFVHYYAKPLENQRHLKNFAKYGLTQLDHHDDPTDRDLLGCNGPELVGGRLLRSGGWVRLPPSRRLLRERLPKLKVEEIEEWLLPVPRKSVEVLGAAPAGLVGPELEQALVKAAATAVGRLVLEGRFPAVLKAKAALVQLVDGSPFRESVSLRRMFDCSKDTVLRLRRMSVAEPIVTAVRWQVEFQLTRRELDRARALAART